MKTVILLALLITCFSLEHKRTTPLDQYVSLPDSTFRYTVKKTIPFTGGMGYILDFRSLSWDYLGVNQTEWQHWVIVIKPNRVVGKTSLIFIDGSYHTRSMPETLPEELVKGAILADSTVFVIKHVPFQPVRFAGEDRNRVEDQILAFTWDRFLKNTSNPYIVAHFPMTKAVVKCMDLAQEFMKKQGVIIEDFVLSGGSKRGWTAYLAAAVDKRVRALIPLVIPILNGIPIFNHIYKSYCFWPRALNPYREMGIMERINTPEFKLLADYIDPIVFNDRYEKMPKYLVMATGDQFFPADTTQFFYHMLKGEKHMRYIANADHMLDDVKVEVVMSILSYYYSIVKNNTRPQYTWTYNNETGKLQVRNLGPRKPFNVLLWKATNPNARVFMVEQIGKVWKRTILDEEEDGVWSATVKPPEKGFTAFNIELYYRSPLFSMVFSTPTYITPDVYPCGNGP